MDFYFPFEKTNINDNNPIGLFDIYIKLIAICHDYLDCFALKYSMMLI